MFGMFSPRAVRMPAQQEALPGRSESMAVPPKHAVLGTPMKGPWPGAEIVYVGMGCFWGAERVFWTLDGVISTAVGYGAGFTPNPTYKEVCSGRTGHNELVQVVFDPSVVSLDAVLTAFWENHNPTQGMRQGNDVGTQYRSGIYCTTPEQAARAEATRSVFQARLTEAGFPAITTEIRSGIAFFYAEDYHQQYLHKNPGGYCGLGGTGVSCPVGVDA